MIEDVTEDVTKDVRWLSLDEASRATSVTMATLRGWCNDGRIEYERRGELRVVRLDQVLALASGPKRSSKLERSTLRRLLNGPTTGSEPLQVAGLQELVRDRLQPA